MENVQRIRAQNEKSSKENEAIILSELKVQGVVSDEQTEIILNLVRAVWEKGYQSGYRNAIEECYEQLGYGDILADVRSFFNFNPENN
jgi:methionine salvage enolase-phosphatase E1